MAKTGSAGGVAGKARRSRGRGKSPGVEFLVRINGSSTIEYVSAEVSSFGYSPSELKGGGIRVGKLIHSDDIEVVAGALARAYHGGEGEVNLRFRILTKSGEPRMVSARVELMRAPEGRVTSYHGVLTEEPVRGGASLVRNR